MKRLERLGALISMEVAGVLERYARDKVVLEIGSFKGGSTVAMAPVAKKIICIDDFLLTDPADTPPEKRIPARVTFEINVAPWRNKIDVYQMDSREAVKLEWEPVGLIFIDGGHDYETVRSDCGFLKWVKVGGYVVFHDMGMASVAQAVNEALVNNPNWRRARLEPDIGIAAFQRKQ